ncbi:MAG: right-handed parallel beta-helix repeat-containing protein [Chitinophagaceae bacterium]|nr:right-handed parallel beta-helix repeat-containing protein [Chitinophagaceae bacterium]
MHLYTGNFIVRCKSLRAFLSAGFMVFCMLSAQAKVYYFSSTGNDANTSTQAQNAATPWRTITKLNSIFNTLVAGDSVLFKRGDLFYGTINVTNSGAFKKHIVITAYGSGANPVVTGFTAVSATSWTSVGSGIYQASVTAGTANLNMVAVNGQPQQIGRYPNADASNGGYLSYESFNDTLSITDNELTSAINWTGAEVVIRKKLWVLDRCKITSHTGNIIYYSNFNNPSSYDCTNNYGYFIQKDVRTLDQQGEWYFDPARKLLNIYFGANVPSSYSVKAATADALVNINFERYITISNIAFEGANSYGIYARTPDFINVQDCSFTNIGGMGIYMENASGIVIQNVSTYNLLSGAIRMSCFSDSNIAIQNCTVKKTGVIRGMGLNGANSYKGISVDVATNVLIENNKVDSTGYVGIEFDGSNALVKNNVVNYFGFNKDDGGGIYTWVPQGNNTDVYYTNRVISSNIVMNGIGAPDGRSSTAAYVSGIYLDGQIMNVDVINNTIFNIGKNGIHCNNPTNINITGNTCFNTLNAVSFMRWPWGTISNLKIKNNIFYPKFNTQRNLYYTNAALNEPVPTTIQSVLQSLGDIDSNYHSRGNEVGFTYEVYSTSGGATVPLSPQSLNGWRAFSNNDINSKKPFREAPGYLLRSVIGNNLFANGSFTSNANGVTVYGTNASANWDNTNKIAGGGLKVEFASPVANRYVLLYASVGAVTAAKNYVLRFSTLGTTANGIIRIYLRKTVSPYTALTPVQIKVFDTTVKKHEVLFAAPSTDAGASFVIEIEQNSGTTYIDNIEFYEADALVYNLDDYLRFEYNAGSTPQTINLGANYVGVDAAYYTGTITLEPFSAKILIKDTAVLRQPLSARTVSSGISCFGGTATITVTAAGGIPPYTGTGTFNVTAGTYTYTVQDLRGVTASATVAVTQPAAPLAATVSTGNIYIFGGVTSVSVSATGGTPPYNGILTYTNVFAGTYTYDVKDARGCVASVTITIKQPLPLKAIASVSAISCYGGSTAVILKATGGIPPYTGTGVFNNVIAGTYTYTVRDAAGAVNTVSVTVTQPLAPLLAAATAGTIATFGGTTAVSINATGGTAPYIGTGVISNVSAGTYTYTVTDAKGCLATTTVTIASPASILTVAATNPVIKCYDGTAMLTVTAAGGLPPYTGTGNYTVNAGKGAMKIVFPVSIANSYTLVYYTVGSVSASKKYALRFSTLGTTANGSLRVSLRQTFSPLSALTAKQLAAYGTTRVEHEFIFTAPTTEAAASFLIEIPQTSGTTYIDNIAFFELGATNNLIGTNMYPFGGFENDLNNVFYYSSNNNQLVTLDTTRKISAVNYFTVTDAANNTATAAVKTSQPSAALQVNASAGAITATNTSTTVTVTATGGTAPYIGTGSFANVAAGVHTYTVTDANGCVALKTITLTPTVGRAFFTAGRMVVREKKELDMIIYPNPSVAAFELVLKGGTNERTLVTVTTADGKIVFAASGNPQQPVSFGQHFATGLYIVKLVQGNVIRTLRAVKIK